MNIRPIAQSSGQPGESLTSSHVGRTADAGKMERAKAIARGEQVEEPQTTGDSQADRAQRDVRKLKMRTNFSTNRDLPQTMEAEPETQAPPAPAETISSIPDPIEPGAVEATQPLSPQFAALAKQKRAFQLEKAEFEKLKAASAGGNSQEFIDKLKQNPLSVLQEHGVLGPDFYNSLTEQLLNGPGHNPEIQALKEELAALKKGVDSQFQSREEQQEEAALGEMLNEAEGLAKEGDAFEMIRSEEAYEDVLRLIHSTYKTTGRVLDVQDAMNQVENKLLARAEKLASINKVRARIAPPPTPPQLQPQRGMRTLTARDTAAPMMDRRARAIAAAMGTLKR